MNSKRVYFGMLGLIGLLLIGLIGGTYGVNTLLQSKSARLVNLKLQSQVLTAQQLGLAKAKKQVADYTDLEKIAQAIVPQDKDQAQAVREIVNLAAEAGIPELSSITFPSSALGGTVSATGTVTGGNNAANKLTQLTPVKGISSGVYQLEITIQQSNDSPVTYDQFIAFLGKLEQNRRTAQVSSITLQPDSKNASKVAFSLIINEFIRP